MIFLSPNQPFSILAMNQCHLDYSSSLLSSTYIVSSLQDWQANSPLLHGILSPSLNTNKITDSDTVKTFVEGYLSIGEWAMDQSVGYLRSSKYFEKKK